MLDTKRQDCSHCKLQQKIGAIKFYCKGVDYVDACPRKLVPKLSDENMAFYAVYSKIASTLFNGQGGYTITHLPHLFEVYDIPKRAQRIFYNKLFVLFEEMTKARAKEIDEMRKG